MYKDQVSSVKQIQHFFSTKFIGLLLEQWKFVIIALIFFTVGALGSFFSVINDSLHLYSILPADIAEGIDPEQLGEAMVQLIRH